MEILHSIIDKLLFLNKTYDIQNFWEPLLLTAGVIFILLLALNKIKMGNQIFSVIIFTFSLSYLIFIFSLDVYFLFNDLQSGNIHGILSVISSKDIDLYHSVDSAARYAMMYGPVPYWLSGLFLKAFGISIFNIHLVYSILFWATVFIYFLIYKKILNFFNAFLITTAHVIYMSAYGIAPASISPDSFTAFFIGIGILAYLQNNKWLSLVLCSFAIGLLGNVKIYTIIYLFPIYILYYKKWGLKHLSILSFSILIVLFLPYLNSHISLKNYLFYSLGCAAGSIDTEEVYATHFLPVLQYLYLAISIPFVLFLINAFTIHRKNIKKWFLNNFISIASWILCLLVMVRITKLGASQQHILATIYLLSFFSFYLLQKNTILKNLNYSLMIPILLFLLASPLPYYKEKLLSTSESIKISESIEDILKQLHGETVNIGFGEKRDGFLYGFTIIPIIHENPVFIPATSPLENMQVYKSEISPNTLNELDSCKISIFLIPKGERPFMYINPITKYFLFNQRFRDGFKNKYKLMAQSQYFDIYKCIN